MYFSAFEGGILLKIKWAKNNQFGDRVLSVPLPLMRDHALCHATAIYVSFMMSQGWGDDSTALVKRSPGKLTPVLYGWFMRKIEMCPFKLWTEF